MFFIERTKVVIFIKRKHYELKKSLTFAVKK